MVSWQDGLLDGLAAVAAVTYLIVAYVQWKRKVSPDARSARNGFVMWWAGIAILGIVGLMSGVLWDPETLSLTGYRVLLYTFIPLIFASLGGLVHYLLYLYTGRKTLLRYVTAFYIALTVAFVIFVEAQDPFVGADPDTGEVGLQYASEAPSWAGLLFSLALLLPPLAVALSYAALFFQVTDRTVRYRILMVSGGFVLWMGFSVLSSLTRFATGIEERGFVSQFISQFLGLLSAVLVLLAYFPPRFLRRALHLRSIQEPQPEPGPIDFRTPPKRFGPMASQATS